jgi:hypothetical protein
VRNADGGAAVLQALVGAVTFAVPVTRGGGSVDDVLLEILRHRVECRGWIVREVE